MTCETVYSVELVSRMTYLSADSLRDTYRGTLRRNVPSIPVTRGSARSPSGSRAVSARERVVAQRRCRYCPLDVIRFFLAASQVPGRNRVLLTTVWGTLLVE